MKKTLIAVVALVAAALLVPSSAQAAVHYFSTTKTVTGIGKASCPSGYRVTGGGAELPADRVWDHQTNATTDDFRYSLRITRPVGTTGWEASGELATTYNVSPNGTGIVRDGIFVGRTYRTVYKPKVYAVCIH